MDTVAETIIEQLGGRRIFALAFDAHGTFPVSNGYEQLGIGADEPGVILRVAKALRPRTYVAVSLLADDTYRVQMFRLGTTRPAHELTLKILEESSGVYADVLREVVERMTGLALTLGTMGGAR